MRYEIPKCAQRSLFDSKYVQLGRIPCILKKETFFSFSGLPPLWSEMLFLRVAACLDAPLALPGLRDDLGGFARELAGLKVRSVFPPINLVLHV